MKKLPLFVALAAAALCAPASTLLAQDSPRPDGDRRRFDPEEGRRRFAEYLKTALKATEEEWAVLHPLIDNVSEKSREARGGGMFGGRPPGGSSSSSGGGDRERGRSSGGSAESQALRDTLQKENASAEEIQAKLTALREHRKKAQAELEAARAELKSVVTTRQEAVLVAFGLLE